jgi:hypothetical protein
VNGDVFGDIEPEDAWDPDDAVAELVDNLRRRVVAILALHVVDARLEQRLAMLADDLEHVFARVRDRLIDRIVD